MMTKKGGIRTVLLALAAVALLVPAGWAQEVPEGGWINLFDGETLFGWTLIGQASFKAEDGCLVCEEGSGGWVATTSQFTDFELTAQVSVEEEGSFGISVRAALDGHPSENGSVVIPIAPAKAGWQNLRIVAAGNRITAEVDDAKSEFQAAHPRGHIGVLYYRTGKLQVKDLKLRPITLTPLFNGENLEGWNEIPGHQSKFAVVDGALNITDGGGQIETAGVYRDFLLQLDIISNGDHLNSGVFYRGPVGVFWKGYESQVRNQWEGDDRTKPVDYGTGGNYGNQAARRVVSTDREWFQKTIVCNDNHTAVWIDGYLVSDYTDMRPVSEECNGKRGYVPGPGTIHLQGHDSTTNLSFKNINIQEYPAE